MSEPRGSEATTPLPVLDKPTETSDPPEAVGTGEVHRFWSPRRVPAAIVAAVLAVVTGAFLYDVCAVRAGRSALAWRRDLATQLAERPLDDTWVLVGAGVAAALGLWLILLAVTPGLRAVLPMRRIHPDVRAGLHRDAVALVLRDRAMEVAGIQSVRVRAHRRRADVRALSHFRDLDAVYADLDAVLTQAIQGLGLVRPPHLSVHVRRPGKKG
ncbi:DUF6286 domain-containing protein [Streptomyces sp. NPDC005820]|uniref:DUF6286 domain-containing protein n=1 Tax=Streptomyces sp. NPDC005820 TaxID=3157069 RepID=UPI0034003BDE